MPGHFADLAPITVHQKQCHYNRYRREATAAGQPPLAPDREWLNQFILAQADISIDRAMSMLAALRYICWREGVEDFTAQLPARHSLHERRCAQRAQQQQLLGLIPSPAVKYCDGYVGAAYSMYTNRHFTKNAVQWEVYAQAHGMSAERPTASDLARYFAHHAPRLSYGSLCNKRRSLRVYFEDRQLPDVTTAPEVTAIFEGARRRPRPTVKHTTPEELRRAIEVLGDAPPTSAIACCCSSGTLGPSTVSS